MQERRSNFDYEDLLACGRGELFAEGPQLGRPGHAGLSRH
jgi:3-hydroxyacyl-[acyl-carrier protein] dehydratase / trans-2-decenoyl-[acyl-carrier protein] isomerase